jgi:DNA-binding response OmpR family regulator
MHTDLIVLVIDDSLADRAWIQLALRDGRIAWLEASDPVRGARIAQAHPVNVVLLDLNIPPLRGIETFDTLRGCGYTGPVVVYTGHTEFDVIEALHKHGVAVAVKGSTDPAGLVRLIEAAAREND